MTKKQVELKAKIRDTKGKKSRQAGMIPAVIYGRKFKPTSLSLDTKEFTKKVLQSEAGENLIFTLKINQNGDSQDVPVITHGIQVDPITDELLHVDLMQVIMDELITAHVPIELAGIAFGVKEEGGVLVHGLGELEIECMPADIPDKITINVQELKINHSLHVSDLKIDSKIKILSNPDEMVASVKPPTKEEEVVAGPTPEEVLAAPGEEGAVPAAAEGEKAPAAKGAAPAAGEKAPADKAGKPQPEKAKK